MRLAITATLMFLSCAIVGCGEQVSTESIDQGSMTQTENRSSNSLVDQVVELSCGQCQLGMDGSGCDLAVRIDGQSYFVDGSSIDDHGDAHGEDGLCNCIREAKVTGEIVDGRFKANSVEVMPAEEDE